MQPSTARSTYFSLALTATMALGLEPSDVIGRRYFCVLCSREVLHERKPMTKNEELHEIQAP
jgi:hypothetical protein